MMHINSLYTAVMQADTGHLYRNRNDLLSVTLLKPNSGQQLVWICGDSIS